MEKFLRPDGRAHNQLRAIRITPHAFGYADSCVLFELGNTKVLCAVTLQMGVPPFLKGKKEGWLNAEYAMLPTATTQRTQREGSALKKNGRSVEISRLISRVLRTMVNLPALGERTITIDCDVLQADGGTRIAAINGSCVALKLAVDQWIANSEIQENILLDPIAAVSVGFAQGQALLDLNFEEDSTGDADFNFVLTKSGSVVEVQGCSEKKAIAWSHFDAMRDLAVDGIKNLFETMESVQLGQISSNVAQQHKKPALFSLHSRFGPGK